MSNGMTHYRGNFNEDKGLLGTQEIINAGLGERQELDVKLLNLYSCYLIICFRLSLLEFNNLSVHISKFESFRCLIA